MTEEEIKNVSKRMSDAADELGEFAQDIIILMVIEHEDKTRQLLYVGRGNYWARIGMAQDFVYRGTGREFNNEDELL